MKFLVLGSKGQVGRALCGYLKSHNHSVVEFDNIDNVQQDISNSLFFNNFTLKDIDFVFFLAFDVGGSRYLKTYQHTFNFLHNNMSILKNVFEVLNQTNVPFLFASSQMSSMTHSPYGLMKRVGEMYTNNLNGLIVKFWNVYGIEHDLNKSHVITDFILKAKSGCIDIITTGQESRQFLYVDDCCEALLNLALNFANLDKQQNYHITSFTWNTILDVANIIQQYIKCDIVPGEVIDTVQFDAKNNPDKFILNYWSPKISIQEGICKIIEKMQCS